MNNEKAQILSRYINGEPTYIPKKMRPTSARNLEEYKIRERLSICNMKHEEELLLLNASKAKENYDKVDAEVYNRIEQHNNEQQKEFLRGLWAKEVAEAQTRGQQICTKNLDFLSKLPDTDPYTGYESINNRITNTTSNTNTEHQRNDAIMESQQKSQYTEFQPPTKRDQWTEVRYKKHSYRRQQNYNSQSRSMDFHNRPGPSSRQY